LSANRFFGALFTPRRNDGTFDCSFGFNYLAILAALCLLAPHVALSQETETGVVTKTPLETGTTVTNWQVLGPVDAPDFYPNYR
jgi:hypothetical protein